MKIVINSLPAIGRPTGIGNYTANLIRGFNLLAPENSYTYYCGYFTKKWPKGPTNPNRIKRGIIRTPIIKSALRDIVDVFSRFDSDEYDIYFEPNFVPLSIRAKKVVVTVHDFCFLLHPEWQPAERIKYLQNKFLSKIKRADRIITDSIHVKEEALHLLKISSESITAIPLGVDHNLFRRYDRTSIENLKSRFNLHEPFILFVGTQEPRKNIDSLLRAYAELPDTLTKEFRLLLVGPDGWRNDATKKLMRSMANRVSYLGYTEPADLALLYNSASLFVFPSLYEGFGLPPLEAMACGCPVIVSRVASLPEVCGDAACYVDPNDIYSIVGGIQRVLGDESFRESLRMAGLARAKLFDWGQTARTTLDVFESTTGRQDLED